MVNSWTVARNLQGLVWPACERVRQQRHGYGRNIISEPIGQLRRDDGSDSGLVQPPIQSTANGYREPAGQAGPF